MTVTIKAPAKINLTLDILGRRDDGYHDLWMVLQSIDIADTVRLKTMSARGIQLTCSEPCLPTNRKNIAYRAAEAFLKAAGFSKTGIKIQLEKRIPCAAGLAGGSADGAAVLLGLNTLLGTNLSMERLCELGLGIGADVPFCLRGGTMVARETGGALDPLPAMPDCTLVLVKPSQDVSTASAYSQYDSYPYECRHPDQSGMVKCIENGDLEGIGRLVNNVFEQFIEVADRVPIKTIMRRHGALGACMSGSGPTVFGLFENAVAAGNCWEELKTFYPNTFLCHPIACGCTIEKNE